MQSLVQAKQTLLTLLQTGTPTILWGPPGIGKTSHVRQIARELGWPVVEVNAPVREPSDFAGYPIPRDEGLRLEPGPWARELARAAQESGGAILFIDEISVCPPSVQNALLRVVLDRVIGDMPLPPEVRVVAAANPAEDPSGGWELTAPLANRFAHIDWPTPTFDEWAAWVQTQAYSWRAKSVVLGYLAIRRELLMHLPQDDVQRGRAWPSPRSWAACASALSKAMPLEGTLTEETIEACAALALATVGPAATPAFVQWLHSVDLPSPEQLLADPGSWQPDGSRIDLIWASLTGVLSAVLDGAESNGGVNKQRWLAAWHLHEKASRAASKGVAIAALGQPLAKAALPGGPAERCPLTPAVNEALEFRRKALS